MADMTTSEPSLAMEIAEAAAAKGVAAIDAPVSGGDVGAREARLSIMIGGGNEPVAAVKLPTGDAVEHGRILQRIGIQAGSVRALISQESP